MKNYIINFFKSIIIGASALIPGVSGGTMAIALGIYDRLLRSVSRFFDDTIKNSVFLFVFTAGSLIGIIAFSGWVLWLFESYRMVVMYFFIGCVVGSIPMLFRKGGITNIKIGDVLWVLLGYLAVMSVSKIPTGSCLVDGYYFLQFLMLMAAGALIAIAFILPGISTSYMLLILGIYDKTLTSIQNADFSFLIPIIIGVFAGTLITARILENAMANHKKHTYMLIVGFVLGSVFEIIPALPAKEYIIPCVLTFILGFVSIKLILHFSEEK